MLKEAVFRSKLYPHMHYMYNAIHCAYMYYYSDTCNSTCIVHACTCTCALQVVGVQWSHLRPRVHDFSLRLPRVCHHDHSTSGHLLHHHRPTRLVWAQDALRGMDHEPGRRTGRVRGGIRGTQKERRNGEALSVLHVV